MRVRSHFIKNCALLLIVLIFGVCASVKPAHALDKRLKLAMKTGGYGAAGGFVIGAGTMALGMGGFRNMLMGASSGFYAGILLAAYIVASQPDKQKMKPKNRYAPRRPVDPDEDWREDDDEDHFKQHLPPEEESRNIRLKIGPDSPFSQPKQVALWSPIVSIQF